MMIVLKRKSSLWMTENILWWEGEKARRGGREMETQVGGERKSE